MEPQVGTQVASTAVATAVPGRVRRSRRGRPGGLRGHRATPYVLIAPFCLVFVCFAVVPLGYALYISLFRSTLFGGQVYAGVSNFSSTLSSGAFWSGVARIAIFGCVQVPIMLAIGLALALVLDSGLVRLSRAFQAIYFIPYAVPGVVAALMWGFMYEPGFGPLNAIAKSLGFGTVNFLGGQTVLASMGNVVTWEWTGYHLIIFYTALQWVPRQLEEAAMVDGASVWQVTWFVKARSILSVVALSGLFSIIGTMQLFTEPSIFAGLTPAVTSSYTPNYYIYTLAFQEFNFNGAAAAAFLLAVVTIAVTVGIVLTRRRLTRTAARPPTRREQWA